MEDYEIQLDSIVNSHDLGKHFRSRNRKYTCKTVTSGDVEAYTEMGWERIGRKDREKVTLRKPKLVGEDFQDEVWCVFYRMGFSEMNGSKEFAIPRYGLDIGKNVDIFAKDDNCICLVECKAAEQPHTKKSLGLSIDQYAAIHKELEHSIRLHYRNKGDSTKYRFRWMLVLKNIDLNDNDYVRAKRANVMIIDSTMIQYYAELAKHLGPASRYQFLSDLYPGMDIPEMIEPIPAIRGRLGGEIFYSFVIEPEKLLKIAYISHRGKTNEESMKTYQRMAKKHRLSAIRKYIQGKQGMFPTNIVLNIETKNKGLRFDQAAEMAGKNAVLDPNAYADGTQVMGTVIKIVDPNGLAPVRFEAELDKCVRLLPFVFDEEIPIYVEEHDPNSEAPAWNVADLDGEKLGIVIKMNSKDIDARVRYNRLHYWLFIALHELVHVYRRRHNPHDVLCDSEDECNQVAHDTLSAYKLEYK